MVWCGDAVLDGGADDAGSDRFGEDEKVADGGAGVREDAIGMDAAGDGEAELGLGVVDGVSADDGDAGLFTEGVAAADDLGEDGEREIVAGEADEVEGSEGIGAHSVYVAQGVGGGNASEIVRVVDDGGEEIGGHDEGEIVGDPVHAGIVTADDADEHVGIGDRGDGPQDLREPAPRELAASAGAVGEAGEAGGGGIGIHRSDVGRLWAERQTQIGRLLNGKRPKGGVRTRGPRGLAAPRARGRGRLAPRG